MRSCSRSNHRFRKKFQLLLAIVHPLCGSMHVVRPSVVLILVLPRHSYQSSDCARILTYPPFGISRSQNQVMPISASASRSGRSRGLSTASGLEGASHCIRRFTCAGPFLLDVFLGEVDWCSTGCTASCCHRLRSTPNLAFQAHLRASHCRVPLMMMIAFITIKSSLVHLIEGLCAQIYFRFEILVVLLTSSSLLFLCVCVHTHTQHIHINPL